MGKLKKILRKVGKGVRKAAPIAMLALGAAALAKRRKAKALNAITAGDIADTGPLSGEAGYEGDVSSKNWITKKSDSDIVPQEEVVTESVPIGKMAGAGTAKQKIANQIKRANFAQRGADAAYEEGEHYTPNLNPYTMKASYPGRVIRGRINRAKGGSAYKSGGRVGVGKAKRGFSKILRKK